MQTLLKAPKLSKDGASPLATRNGSILAAVVTAAVAGLLIVLFLSQYRNSINEDGVPTPVLVAQQLIAQGASADSAGEQALFKTIEVPRDQLKPGAITDAATLRGKVAVAQIVPGQQLRVADFAAAGNGLVTKLAADQRAISVPFDSAHGLLGNLAAGDRVDVLLGFAIEGRGPVLRMLMQDVLVLGVPAAPTGGGTPGAGGGGGGGAGSGNVTLRAPVSAIPKIAFAADNGRLWLVLRPRNGEKLDRSSLVSIGSLLVDTKPVKARR